MPFEVLEMVDCLEFWLLTVKKYLKMPQIRVSQGLKSKYLKLRAEYSIRTPETPYRLSINGLLTAIVHFRCCRWPISSILGLKGDKNSQNDQNQGLKWSKIKISEIGSRIFNQNTCNSIQTQYKWSSICHMPLEVLEMVHFLDFVS